MKYVMLETKLAGVSKKVPVIFPDFLCHDTIAGLLKLALIQDCKLDSNVISAGDIQLLEIECSGESDTLKVSSAPDDVHTIERYDYFHGM